jgi:hypothetical protein
MEPLEAHLAVAAPDTALDEFMFMPGGVHQICCKNAATGKTVHASVEVTRASAAAVQAQFSAVAGRKAPHKPYFDLNHSDAEASFWPSGFAWCESPVPGIYARGEWSAAGRTAIEGKNYRTFSPKFWVDDPAGNPARIISNPDSKLNFGGLVNDPAFEKVSPLWAKNAGDPGQSTPTPSHTMNPEELAELRAKQKQLETDITELKAKAATDATAASQLKAKEADAKANASALENAELKAKVVKFETAARELRAKNAKDAVTAAIKRGALEPKNTELQAKWEKWCSDTPEMISALENLRGAEVLDQSGLTAGQTAGLQAKAGPLIVLKAYAALVAKNAKVKGQDTASFKERGAHALEMGAIWANDIRKDLTAFKGVPLSAAADADTAGTLAGTLVTQRTLELFKYEFPMFQSIYTDFDDVPANFKQNITTRIISVPAVQTYSQMLGADGRPGGWNTVVPATMTDVTISLDEHVGVPIVFDANILASTTRRLFDEIAPAANYALGKYFVDKIYGKITAANFNAYAAIVANTVPVAYATYPVGLVDFARSHLANLAGILTQNLVPTHDRSVMLNVPYHAQLTKDPSLVTFYAGQREPGIINEGTLPRLAGFQPVQAPNMPSANNIVGFAMQKNALLAVTRLSNDYTQALPGSSFGNVTTVTNPDTGMSVVLVQYVDHRLGYAEWRIQCMLGAGVGDNRAGLIITSQ